MKRGTPAFEMAKNLGYVESLGQEGPPRIRRGDLVPYDHPTSPLSEDEIRELKTKGYVPGVIVPK